MIHQYSHVDASKVVFIGSLIDGRLNYEHDQYYNSNDHKGKSNDISLKLGALLACILS